MLFGVLRLEPKADKDILNLQAVTKPLCSGGQSRPVSQYYTSKAKDCIRKDSYRWSWLSGVLDSSGVLQSGQ